MKHRAEPAPDRHPDDVSLDELIAENRADAYRQGVGEAGARLIGAAAAELGYEHPALDRMARALGELSR